MSQKDDTISRQAAIDAVYKCADIFAGDMPVMVVKADAYEALAQLPSAQPTIEPKKGKWIKREDRAGWYCSECATDDYYAYLYNSDTGVYELQDKFCPNCGTDMRGEQNELN